MTENYVEQSQGQITAEPLKTVIFCFGYQIINLVRPAHKNTGQCFTSQQRIL